MSWKEIARKFDEIVAFSEMEPYLDMPVKRYSSGMYMRLAFAVAAHLDPDILLIDEALAVGDLNFRRKCTAKMQSFVKSGATVLFVSHNMALLAETCTRALLLEKGRLVQEGPVAPVIQRYLQNSQSGAEIVFPPDHAPGLFARVRINRGQPVVFDAAFELEVNLRRLSPGQRFTLGFGLASVEGTRLLSCEENGPPCTAPATGELTLRVSLPALALAPGLYLLDLMLRDETHQVVDHRLACAQIEVTSDEKTSHFFSPESGGVQIPCRWELL
jgi:lipopolysaccharide transport system ATP-binding protein